MWLLPTSYYCKFGSVYMSMPLSHVVPAYPSPSPCPQVYSLVGLRLYSRLAPRFFIVLVSKCGLGRWSGYIRVSNLFCKAPVSQFFWFYTSYSFYPSTQFCHSPKAAIDEVRVCSGCHNKIPETGRLNNRHLFSHRFGGW